MHRSPCRDKNNSGSFAITQMEVEVRHIAFWDIHFLWVKKMLYVSYIKYSSHWKSS